MDLQLMLQRLAGRLRACMSAPAHVSLSVWSRARVVAFAVCLVPACCELRGVWPFMAHIGDGRCVEHLPAQFLPTAEPFGQSL